MLARADIEHARLLVVTAPEPFRARRIVEVARAANPTIAVAVRTHSAAEQAFFEHYLTTAGARGRAVYSEREAALSMAHFALEVLGSAPDDADRVIAALRGQPTGPTETFRTLATQEYQAFLKSEGTGEPRAPDTEHAES